MPKSPDVYDRLKTTKLDELTVSNLNDATKESFIESNNVQLWSQSITLDRALDAGRTFPHGLPIPELCGIESETVANGASTTIKPDGNEIWRILAISADAALSIALFDGATGYCVISTDEGNVTYPDLYITPTLYISINNGTGDSATCNVAYCKVSL